MAVSPVAVSPVSVFLSSLGEGTIVVVVVGLTIHVPQVLFLT